ncbi:MAG: WecB/TagA/CpsF family glycosyltransferase [Ignavibacteriales bacterium]|nr:WecB/TagA/CpsF family glycosyltransferase [Ignavibacteriales bacterium]
MKRIKIFDTYIDAISIEEVVQNVFVKIESKEKANIFFQNALKVYEIRKNIKLKNALENADFILADGVSILWASKLLGNPLPGRVNGTDLFELLLVEAERKGKSIFLLGATESNLTYLLDVLRKKYPDLIIAGHRNGYFDDDDISIIEQINKSNADILFLGFSSPKKEIWAYKNKEFINVPIVQGVGGSFDVVAGIIPRAPVWMQKSGLEWLFRLIKEPSRMFKRYFLGNMYFIAITIKYFFKYKFSKKY